jgi:hypothetical protein
VSLIFTGTMERNMKSGFKYLLDMLLILAGILLLALTNGCAGGGPSKALPEAQANAATIAEHVTSADTHMGAVESHVDKAQGEVRAAMPSTTQPAAGHLKNADAELTAAKAEAATARAESKAAKDEVQSLQGNLEDAQQEHAKALAQAKEYKDRYDNQWFAGKFWRAFWIVAISVTLIVVACLALNFYTDLFVVPLRHIGQWVADMLASTVKAVRELVAGIWNEIASLFKKKPAQP